MMMMITAFGATNVLAANNKYNLAATFFGSFLKQIHLDIALHCLQYSNPTTLLT